MSRGPLSESNTAQDGRPAHERPSLAVLVTCHNRRSTTLSSLRALDAAIAGCCRYDIVLVDDASTDGTAESVASAFENARIIRGPGDLYWNGGMRLAWQEALPLKPDFFLWLNDDTVLRPGAVADLLTLYRQSGRPHTIAVGRTAHPDTGESTYGGFRRRGGLSRLNFRMLLPHEQQCDTMNGNCVLIPASAVRDIGINAEHYRHAYGDLDYGLRARRAGYQILELKAPVAIQDGNEAYFASIRRLSLKNWKFILFHPKGVPLCEWRRFCATHGGPLWIANFLLRYFRMMRKRLADPLLSHLI